ncbi:MAG: hypothetical protein ACJAV5_002295 [Vicingaceae bacterium]|jgi:hypothetical protein
MAIPRLFRLDKLKMAIIIPIETKTNPNEVSLSFHGLSIIYFSIEKM